MSVSHQQTSSQPYGLNPVILHDKESTAFYMTKRRSQLHMTG
uniref:Uncharacterized protein n=1 Tax=Leclercia adecarboxylata TaxID=83655 RepID=A0A7G5F632_9ENTR|nr:hypothetical protein [Leclercia adecarboxylata]